MNRSVQLVVVLLLCLWGVAGCGSPGTPTRSTPATSGATSAMSGRAYRNFLQHLSHQEDKAHRAVDSALHAGSVATMRKGFLGFAADQQRVSEELSSITPPRNAATANAALAHAFALNHTAIRQLVTAMARATTTKQALSIVMSAQGPQRSGREIDAALSSLKKLGYTSGT
jgi:hypothetical protein